MGELDAHDRVGAELGADAVVGVELTHGDGKRPMHLSGLAVRVLR